MSHSFSVIDCMLLYNVDKLARRYFSMGGTEQLEGQQSVRRLLVCKSVCVWRLFWSDVWDWMENVRQD